MWEIPIVLKECPGCNQSIPVMTSGPQSGTRSREATKVCSGWQLHRMTLEEIHSGSLLTNSQHENADALLGFQTASFFHSLFQSQSSSICAQLWAGLQACTHLYASLMPILLSQVPEWGHSCARSPFVQPQKRGGRIRSSQKQICSSSAWARASAQNSLSGCILWAWGYHVVSQETDHMGQVAVPPCASASPLENRGTPCLTWVLAHFTILTLLNDGFFRFLKSMPSIF